MCLFRNTGFIFLIPIHWAVFGLLYFTVVIGLVFAGALIFSAAAADVAIRIAPPRIVVEHRGHPPNHGDVWFSGYHRWDGDAYVWTGGRWEHPPRPGTRWVVHR